MEKSARRSRWQRPAARALAALGGLALLAGCSGVDQVTKAGAQAAPITLRIGTGDIPETPAADQIEQFAREVAARSEGRLQIDPDWDAVTDDGDDWDQEVARKVVAGDLDLGVISARAWDTEGVTSLRALNAPMLVTSDALVEQVITGDLASTMLAGLEPIGVTGLALLPEGIRRVFWLHEPMPSVADFRGAFLRVPASATTYATFEALGARPDDVTATREAIESGDVDGVELSFLLSGVVMGGSFSTSTTVGNLPLWPKANALVANQGVLNGLPEDLQAVLRDAAAATRTWAVEALPSDDEAARSFCESGGRVVVVDDAEVEAFRTETAKVIEELERDATTRELIAAIEALKSESPAAEGVPACGP